MLPLRFSGTNCLELRLLAHSLSDPAAASAGEQAPLIGGTDQRSRKPLDRLFDGLRWAAYDAVTAGFSRFLLSLSVC